LLRKLTLNPAAVLYVINAIVAMVVTWGWHPGQGATAAIDTIATGVLTVIAAFLTRPVGLSTAAAAAITVFTAFGAFGLHWDPTRITSTVAVASIILGFALHALGIPFVAARQGTTATQLLLSEPNKGSE
jgi:hypothetical protein